MQASVNKELCIGCGICEPICPRVFVLDADRKASVKVDPLIQELDADAQEAEGQCPVAAIIVSKELGGIDNDQRQ